MMQFTVINNRQDYRYFQGGQEHQKSNYNTNISNEIRRNLSKHF